MPMRRTDYDYIPILKAASIQEDMIRKIASNMDSIESKLDQSQMEKVVKKLVDSSKFREDFIRDPTAAVKSIITRFPPVP
ncbi:MAG: hypothetical protein GF411_09270 [Candidatus Lokiarchaeota archaeon]|nr:hypothetical protein [Candidatus Lokiarchaeota archaeon]